MQSTIVMMAKAPGVDACKTRLIPPLTRVTANALQAALIQDIWAQIVLSSQYDCWIATPSINGVSYFKSLTPRVLVQRGRTLGDKMRHIAEALFVRGYGHVIFIGGDMPLVTYDLLESAMGRLVTVPCVLGPAEDGGYYLIGLTPAAPDVFAGIPWGTDRVLETTRQRLKEAGTPYTLLTPHRDIDVWDDVEFYAHAPSIDLPHFRHWWVNYCPRHM